MIVIPRVTDSDADRERTIVLTCNVECLVCGTVFDVQFDTGKFDEDGLTDLEPEDLVTRVTCVNPDCKIIFNAEFEGWLHFGGAE